MPGAAKPWKSRRVRASGRCTVAVLVAMFGFGSPLAAAAVTTQNIHSDGALTDVWIGSDLSCQVARKGADTYAFFPPRRTPADCGTFLAVGGRVFGPDFAGHPATSFPGAENYVPFTPTSQSNVTGAGTAASPYQIVTSVSAGDTGLTVTQADSYVTSDESYRTDIGVANPGPAPVTALLYHAGDCYLEGSDTGFGAISPHNSPACAENADNRPSGQVEELFALTSGFHYVEGLFDKVWADVLAGGDLPDSCDCGIEQDNGVALSWNITIPPGGSVHYALITNLSSTGQVIGAPSAVTGPATLSPDHTTVAGSVNPQGNEVTDCHFTWGKSTSYGHSAPCAESVGGGTSPVDVSAKLPAVDAGETYHYRLSATTSGGTMTGEDRTFSRPPPPKLGRSANVVPISGTVLVKTPRGSGGNRSVRGLRAIAKGRGFVPVTELRQIPMGSTIYARRAKLDLVAAGARPGNTATARLAGGLFSVNQIRKGRRKGLTTFTLRQGLFKGAPSFRRSCPRRRKGRKSSVAHISRASRKALQTLKARNRRGKFRTKGRHSAATVRGTVWETTNRCDGTLTTVRRGVVDVRNFGNRKTVPVPAGYHYLSAADISKQRGPRRNR